MRKAGWLACGAWGALLVILGTTASIAQEALLNDWYVALAGVDRARLATMLATDVHIRLTDLDVEQTKAEFLASLDEWQQAAVGATIRFRIEKTEGSETTVIACYDFPANDVLMRETFRIENELIVENEQTTIAETCEVN